MNELTEKWIIEDTLKLLLQVSRVFGSAPVRFESNNGNYSSVRISRFLYFYSILLACVVNIPNIYYFFVSLNNEEKDLKIYYDLTFYNIQSFVTLVANYSFRVFPLIGTAIYSRRRIRTILCCYSHVQQIRKSMNNNICQSNIKKWKVFVLLIIYILGLIMVFCFNEWVTRKAVIYYIYKFICLEMWIVMECQFAFVATCANLAFKDINTNLGEVLSLLDVVKTTARPRIASLIRQLSESFISTCEVINELYSTDSFYLFLYIVSTAIGLEISILYVYQGSEFIDLRYIAVGVIWVFYHVLRIIVILEPCHRIQNEILYTKILVGQLMCHSSSDTKCMIDVMDTFYKQLLLNNVTASALGVFTLDRLTLSLIFGTASTFFVILKYMNK